MNKNLGAIGVQKVFRFLQIKRKQEKKKFKTLKNRCIQILLSRE